MGRRETGALRWGLAACRARAWLAPGAFLVLLGCATVGGAPTADVAGGAPYLPRANPPIIAVLPFENLSASPAPLKQMRASLLERLRQRGLTLLDEEKLQSLMARHRVRFTGGVDKQVAEAFQRESGVGGILITSLGRYLDQDPPNVVLVSRLASTDTPSMVTWADSAALSGDDAPGFLGLGLVESMRELMPMALDRLADSLASHLLSGNPQAPEQISGGRFRPRSYYRAPSLQEAKRYRIAVLPVVNRGDRKYAGEMLAGILIEQLTKSGGFKVLEPGFVREELLKYRIVSPEGASLDTVDILFGRLDVDLLFTGRIIDYDDARGSGEAPRVTFSVQVIENRGREVVWASQSTNLGDEGVFFFGMGRVTTAHELASRMVAQVVQRMRGAGALPAKDKRDAAGKQS